MTPGAWSPSTVIYLMLYESTLDSAKVMNLSLEAKGFWMLCLLAASRNRKERGTLPDMDDLALIARTTEADAARLVDVLVAARLLVLRNDMRYEVYHWEEYQPKTSKDRTQLWRERQKAAARHVTSRDVTNVTCDGGDEDPPKTDTQARDGVSSQKPQSVPSPKVAKRVTSRDKCDARDETRRDGNPSVRTGAKLDHQACIDFVRGQFGEREANRLECEAPSIGSQIGHRWDCYAAALRNVRRSLDRENSKPVENLVALCVTLARGYTETGIPPEPETIAPSGKPTSSPPPRLPPPDDKEVERVRRMLDQKAAKVRSKHEVTP